MTHLIERFTEHLKKGKYNSATISAYRNAIFVFYNHFRDYSPSKITDELISDYLIGIANTKTSKQDATQTGKAIKLFFEVIFSKVLNIKATGKIKEEQSIDILSKEELVQLFNSIKNMKHKLLIMLVYSVGLKINEVINLESTDIDIENNIIIIRNKNSKKTRSLRLAPNLDLFIEQYLMKYNPTKVLFPGSSGEGFYSARNIQLFFHKAVIESGINKPATLNTLRHSFAVHSLQSGIDVHILQQVLGHNNIQTTSAYLQFVKTDFMQLRSPIENLELPNIF